MAKPKKVVTKKPSLRQRLVELQSRRPHRSFQRSKRRDYRRSLQLPGYIAFTFEVGSVLKRHWRLFSLLAITYVILGITFGAMTSQDTYNAMSGTVHAVSDGVIGGNVGAVLQAGAISFTSFISGNKLSGVQKVYMALVFILTWLTTVWLLREISAGCRPRLRDGIYNAGAPLVSTMLVMLWFLVQLLPIAAVMILYSGLASAGLMANGFGAFLFAVCAALIISLVLYWLTATFFAAVIVTLPGMYPWRAIHAAGDVVVGRRLRILYRILWLFATVAFVWFAVMIPVVLLDTWLVSVADWVVAIPWVPLLAIMLSAMSIVYICSYVYLLYRKVVADDASPA